MSPDDAVHFRAEAVRFAMSRVEVGRARGNLRARVATMRSDGGSMRVRVSIEEPLSNYVARYNARSGELLGWFFELMMAELGRDGVPESTCLQTAQEIALPPEGAVLHRYGYEDLGGSPMFVVRWRHEHEGLSVEGDSLIVQLNGRNGIAFSFHRRWHSVDGEPTDR